MKTKNFLILLIISIFASKSSGIELYEFYDKSPNKFIKESLEKRLEAPEYIVIKGKQIKNHSEPSFGNFLDSEYSSWFDSHGDLGSSRYSSLDLINKQNAHLLELAWSIDLIGHKNQVQSGAVFDGKK